MKASPVINSFNAGELSPRMYGRTDFEKYNNGCLKLENFNIYPQGGVSKRPAQKFIVESKDNEKIRIIPFIYSSDEAYHMELGEKYIRFIKDGVQLATSLDPLIPLEIGSPYLESELYDIDYTQIADVMWLTHPNHPITTIRRYIGDQFVIGEYELDVPPYLEKNQLDLSIWPSATSGDISLYASDNIFSEDHIGSTWKISEDRTVTNASVSGTTAVAGITSSINVAFSHWTITTRGKWKGRCMIERSVDGGVTWNDYILLGDTSGVTKEESAANFTTSSDTPELANVFLRISITDLGLFSASEFGYDISPDSITWDSVVKITGYVSETEVEATVLSNFQNVLTDYTQ